MGPVLSAMLEYNAALGSRQPADVALTSRYKVTISRQLVRLFI